MAFVKYIINKIAPVVILILVWLIKFRPFTWIIQKINVFLKKPIGEDLTSATMGAINVAVTTLFLTLIKDLFRTIVKKRSEIKIDIFDKLNGINCITVKFDETKLDNPDVKNVSIKLDIKLTKFHFYLFKKICNGLRITIYWHNKWLSLTERLKDHSNILSITERPGYLYFNVIDCLSESDLSTVIEGKLMVIANSERKKNGYISAKVESNCKNKIGQILTNILVNISVKKEIKNCEVLLERR